MSILALLVIFAVAVAAGFAVLLLEQFRHDRRSRTAFCMTCGQYHPRHSAHR
ncbi:hypothetical protein [Streptomyces beijiangensis]|uniref:Uncharacterized protein n=1 Tax=Streptomyces beijiangensis TaxID=163361 RepID=A0A939FG01_9ACTN|nr:hypothetical protein [Streptomyces beijiangensis]MBO0517694.1 hypothetical protein [Streptomyces beijiangensis]